MNTQVLITLLSNVLVKVQLFWEGHKHLRNRPHGFDIYLVNVKTMRTIAQIFVAFSEKLNFTNSKEQLGSYCLNIYFDRKKETVIGEAQRKCETMHNSFVFCLVNFFFSFFHVLPCHVCMFLLFFFCTSFLSKQEIKGVNMQDRRKKVSKIVTTGRL